MKKFLLFAAALGCAFASKAADYSLPFSFTASEETFSQCTVIDVDHNAVDDPNAGTTGGWAYYASSPYAFKYTYSSSVDADDWLILPAVDSAPLQRSKYRFRLRVPAVQRRNSVFILGILPLLAA